MNKSHNIRAYVYSQHTIPTAFEFNGCADNYGRWKVKRCQNNKKAVTDQSGSPYNGNPHSSHHTNADRE